MIDFRCKLVTPLDKPLFLLYAKGDFKSLVSTYSTTQAQTEIIRVYGIFDGINGQDCNGKFH